MLKIKLYSFSTSLLHVPRDTINLTIDTIPIRDIGILIQQLKMFIRKYSQHKSFETLLVNHYKNCILTHTRLERMTFGSGIQCSTN